MKLSIRLIKNNDEIIANCPELDINCYGSNKDEAIRRIKNVIHFYVDSAKELGLEVESLDEISIKGDSNYSYVKEPHNRSNTIN